MLLSDNSDSQTDEYSFFPYAIAQEWLERVRNHIDSDIDITNKNEDRNTFREEFKSKYLKNINNSSRPMFFYFLFCLIVFLFVFKLYDCLLVIFYILIGFLIARLISKLEHESFLEYINVNFSIYKNFKKKIFYILIILYMFVFPALVANHIKAVAEKTCHNLEKEDKNKIDLSGLGLEKEDEVAEKIESISYDIERPYDMQEELNQSIPLRFRN